MKINKIYIWIFLICLYSCKQSVKESEKNVPTLGKDNILEEQINTIKNRKIQSLKNIFGDSIQTKNRVIFLYNGYDCETCVDIGYEMLKKMDSISQTQMVYVISTSANIGRDQLKNNYTSYVYEDEKDLIRKELKFIYTPVFISFNSNNKIDNAFFPNYNRNKKKENDFIKNCIKKTYTN